MNVIQLQTGLKSQQSIILERKKSAFLNINKLKKYSFYDTILCFRNNWFSDPKIEFLWRNCSWKWEAYNAGIYLKLEVQKISTCMHNNEFRLSIVMVKFDSKLNVS